MATDPASPLNITPVNIFTKAADEQYLQQPLPIKSAWREPHLAPKHNNSQIYWGPQSAGLLPENQQLEHQRSAIWQDNQLLQKTDNESLPMSTGQKT